MSAGYTVMPLCAWSRFKGPQKECSFVSALVAQWIEHQTSNLGVAGSSPARGILFDIVVDELFFLGAYNRASLAEWLRRWL